MIESTDTKLFTAIKGFLMEFVISDDYPEFDSENITQAYPNYIAQSGENDFIVMTLYDDSQPIIINKTNTVKDESGNYIATTYIRTDWSFIVEFYGKLGAGISSSFRSKFNSSHYSVDWFKRNYGVVPLSKATRMNNNMNVDQKSFIGKYDVMFKMQSVEVVRSPVPKITKIEVVDYAVI